MEWNSSGNKQYGETDGEPGDKAEAKQSGLPEKGYLLRCPSRCNHDRNPYSA